MKLYLLMVVENEELVDYAIYNREKIPRRHKQATKELGKFEKFPYK
jgi:hypothetical protein